MNGREQQIEHHTMMSTSNQIIPFDGYNHPTRRAKHRLHRSHMRETERHTDRDSGGDSILDTRLS